VLITLKLRVAEASSGDNSTTIACGSTKIANRQELLDVAPGALIIPSGHGSQRALPSMPPKVPSSQSEQSWRSEPRVPFRFVPAGHFSGATDLSGQKLPKGQSKQRSLAAPFAYVPAGQSVQAACPAVE
jgi:hypothetical protein